jgi:Protein of unknown function, DUF481
MKVWMLVGMAGLLLGLSARAEDGPYFSPTTDRVRISLGVTPTSATTDLRIDSTTGTLGTPINVEQDFGLDKKKIGPKFQAMIRVGERHRLRFDYYTLDRESFKNIEKPITFRNENLVVGDPVDSNLSLRTLGITYGYSFIRRDKFELAATLGVNLLDISARVRVQTPNRRIDQRQDLAGPFPTAGLDATWVISKRFSLDARAQYLKVSVSDLDGSLGFFEASLQYRWRANVSLGLGYNKVRAKLSSTKTNESGFFDFNTKGPEAFVRVAF